MKNISVLCFTSGIGILKTQNIHQNLKIIVLNWCFLFLFKHSLVHSYIDPICLLLLSYLWTGRIFQTSKFLLTFMSTTSEYLLFDRVVITLSPHILFTPARRVSVQTAGQGSDDSAPCVSLWSFLSQSVFEPLLLALTESILHFSNIHWLWNMSGFYLSRFIYTYIHIPTAFMS